MVLNIKNIFTISRMYHFFKLATIALVIVLMGLQIFCVFNFPIWRDDAFFGSVAKNLVSGEGYKAIFFDKGYSFHYGITTGPFVIVPAALMMFIFGNHYWVIGLANILLIWSLLVPIFILSKDVIGEEKRWPFAFFSLFLVLIFSTGNEGGRLALWYLLMGEVPAALCVILASFLLLLPKQNIKKLAIGGLFLGFAAISKANSMIAAIVILAVVANKILFENKLSNLQKVKFVSIPILCFIAPSGLFELIKIVSLGWNQYCELQMQNAQHYEHNGLVQNEYVSGHIFSLVNFFSTSGVLLVPTTFYMIYLAYKERPTSSYFAIGATLITCFVVYLVWWVNFAIINSYRHLFLAFFCYFVGLSLLLCGIKYKTKLQFALVAIFILYLLDCGLKKNAFEFLRPKLEEQLKVTSAIKELQEQGYEMISCGNNFELEYLLPKNGNFRPCTEIIDNSFDHPAILVNQIYEENLILSIQHNQFYGKFKPLPEPILSRCNREYLKTENFSLLWCKI